MMWFKREASSGWSGSRTWSCKGGTEGKATGEKSIVRDPDDNGRVYMPKDEINVRKNIDNPIKNGQRI